MLSSNTDPQSILVFLHKIKPWNRWEWEYSSPLLLTVFSFLPRRSKVRVTRTFSPVQSASRLVSPYSGIYFLTSLTSTMYLWPLQDFFKQQWKVNVGSGGNNSWNRGFVYFKIFPKILLSTTRGRWPHMRVSCIQSLSVKYAGKYIVGLVRFVLSSVKQPGHVYDFARYY